MERIRLCTCPLAQCKPVCNKYDGPTCTPSLTPPVSSAVARVQARYMFIEGIALTLPLKTLEGLQ